MLKGVGDMPSFVQMENCMRKDHRRLRAVSKASPDVLCAMARTRALEQEDERKRRRLLAEDNKRRLTAEKLKKEVADAHAELKKKKDQILDLEGQLVAKHAIKNFALSSLGYERHNCGGPSGRKQRLELLDRLASLGNGLSPAQRNDWPWFKAAWVEKDD